MKFDMTENGFETTTAYGQLTISGNDDYGFRPYQYFFVSTTHPTVITRGTQNTPPTD